MPRARYGTRRGNLARYLLVPSRRERARWISQLLALFGPAGGWCRRAAENFPRSISFATPARIRSIRNSTRMMRIPPISAMDRGDCMCCVPWTRTPCAHRHAAPAPALPLCQRSRAARGICDAAADSCLILRQQLPAAPVPETADRQRDDDACLPSDHRANPGRARRGAALFQERRVGASILFTRRTRALPETRSRRPPPPRALPAAIACWRDQDRCPAPAAPPAA